MSSKTNSDTESDQILTERTTIPEDITAFYDKIDKEDEDEEEDQELKTVSFEVNQVSVLIYLIHLILYICVYKIQYKYYRNNMYYIYIIKRKKLKLYKNDALSWSILYWQNMIFAMIV